MSTHGRSRDDEADSDRTATPEVSVCETCPDTSVFIEAENADGWIASDVTVDVER
ncbi:MAG: hypothetical protein ABEH66_02480 [Halobacteriales archaeon]